MRKRIDTTTVESPDSGIMDMSSYGFSPAFSKPALNLSFEVERRRAAAEEGDSSYYSTTSSSASDFSPLDHIRDRILGVGHGRRGGRRRTALFDSSSPSASPLQLGNVARAVPYLVVVVVLASAAFTAVTLTSLLNRDGGVWRTGGDPAAAKDLNGKYASMQFAHKARAKRLAEEGRLAPEEATVDEDGVQLGGKRAAILYAHRLREAAPAAVVVDEGEEAAKADDEEKPPGGDIGDMDLKRTLEEIKRLQAEASSLRQENIQLKTAENDDIEQDDEEEEEERPKPKVVKRSPKTPRRRNPFRKTNAGGGAASSSSREERAADAGEDDPFRFV